MDTEYTELLIRIPTYLYERMRRLTLGADRYLVDGFLNLAILDRIIYEEGEIAEAEASLTEARTNDD